MIYKRLLVPLDGSSLSEKGLDYAKGILSKDGQITLLTVVKVPDVYVYTDAALPLVRAGVTNEKLLKQSLESSRLYLNSLARRLRLENVSVTVCVEAGDPATIITDTAQKMDAVVMSTHGRSGLSRLLYGSVTRAVLDRARCPVIVVPAHQFGAVTVHDPVEEVAGV